MRGKTQQGGKNKSVGFRIREISLKNPSAPVGFFSSFDLS